MIKGTHSCKAPQNGGILNGNEMVYNAHAWLACPVVPSTRLCAAPRRPLGLCRACVVLTPPAQGQDVPASRFFVDFALHHSSSSSSPFWTAALLKHCSASVLGMTGSACDSLTIWGAMIDGSGRRSLSFSVLWLLPMHSLAPKMVSSRATSVL